MSTSGDNVKSALAGLYDLNASDLQTLQKLTHEQKVEGLLQRIVDTQVGGSGSSTQRTPGLLSTTSSGTISAGAQSVSILNNGGSAGTVLGVSLPAGTSLKWSANSGDTLAAISYNATGTNFLITEVR